MKSLFIRTYLSVIAFTVISFFLILHFIVNPALDNDSWQYFKESALSEYQLVEDTLSQQPSENWEKLILEYVPTYDNSVELIPMSDLLDDNDRSTLAKPGPQRIIAAMEDYPWFIFFSLQDTDRVLVISEYEYADESNSMSLSEQIQTFFPLVLVTLAQLLGVILLVRMIKSPVDKLVKTTEHFGRGDFSVRAQTDSPEPISKLAIGFNYMADKVQQTMADKEVMIAAIPHELQTPLSRLRFLLELSRKKESAADLRTSIDKFEDNFEELESAVSDILELTRIANFNEQEQEQFQIWALLQPISKYYSGHQSISIETRCDENLVVNAHAELLNRAIRNLVQNAFKYASSTCCISAVIELNQIVVRVEDDGIGIPEESREQLLTPFSRLDHSRNQETGGLGLGLALVKMIMDHHKGDVKILDSAVLGGALIELRWPLLR